MAACCIVLKGFIAPTRDSVGSTGGRVGAAHNSHASYVPMAAHANWKPSRRRRRHFHFQRT